MWLNNTPLRRIPSSSCKHRTKCSGLASSASRLTRSSAKLRTRVIVSFLKSIKLLNIRTPKEVLRRQEQPTQTKPLPLIAVFGLCLWIDLITFFFTVEAQSMELDARKLGSIYIQHLQVPDSKEYTIHMLWQRGRLCTGRTIFCTTPLGTEPFEL
jgi:hypothetical protein